MKKIKSLLVAAIAFAMVAPVFTACSSDDKNETVENIISEFSVNDKMVAAQKAKNQGSIRGRFPQCRCLCMLLERHLHQPRQCW